MEAEEISGNSNETRQEEFIYRTHNTLSPTFIIQLNDDVSVLLLL